MDKRIKSVHRTGVWVDTKPITINDIHLNIDSYFDQDNKELVDRSMLRPIQLNVKNQDRPYGGWINLKYMVISMILKVVY